MTDEVEWDSVAARIFARRVNELEAENADLCARLADAERSEQEMRGVVETYGKLEASQLHDQDQLEMRWRVSLALFAAGGFEVFYASIREARKNFEAWQKSPFAARTSVPTGETTHA